MHGNRSTVFFYRFCAELIAECFVPPVTYVLMEKNTWTPLLVAVGFQTLTIVVAFVLPETLPVAVPETARDFSTDPPRVSGAPALHDNALLEPREKWFQQIKESYAFVTRDAAVASLVFTFLISKVGRLANNVLFQYVSKRYGWSLSQASVSQSTLIRLVSNRLVGWAATVFTCRRKYYFIYGHPAHYHKLRPGEKKCGLSRSVDWTSKHRPYATWSRGYGSIRYSGFLDHR
jgi:hypothetical protein